MSADAFQRVVQLPPPDADAAVCEVLVVGAGPTGLLLGCHLRELGVDVVIVDPHLSPGEQGKAAVLMPRSFEVLELATMSARLHEQSRPLTAARWGFDGRWRGEATGFPVKVSPCRFDPMAVGQNVVEAGLEARFRELGGRLFRAARFVSFEDTENRVLVNVERDVSGPLPQQASDIPPYLMEVHRTCFRAKYVVGCDGPRSTVREARGIEFVGTEYPHGFLIADVELDEEEVVAKGMDKHQFFFMIDSGRICLFLHMLGNVWRAIYVAPDLSEDMATEQTFRSAWSAMLPEPGMPETARFVYGPHLFHACCRVSKAYRSGRCFLAGDAAHSFSPAGAQGLNTGLQDAANLAWKLAAVLRGWAPDGLLDSYELERRPVADWVRWMTDWAFSTLTSMNLFPKLFRNVFLRFLLPLMPSRYLPPSWMRAKMFGLGHSYATAETGQCSGLPATTNALVAGDRLPDLKCQLEGGVETTLLQLLCPVHLRLRLLLLGPDDISDELLKDALDEIRGASAWPVELFLWDTDGGRGDMAPQGKDVEVRVLKGGRELADAFQLGDDEHAQVVVRPDGRIAVVNRGQFSGSALATALAARGLARPA